MEAGKVDPWILKYVCRYLPDLQKALDKTKLVQVPVQYKKKDGTTGTRLQWVDKNSKLAKDHAAKQEEQPDVPKKEAQEGRPAKPKKEQKPIGNIRIMEGMHMIDSTKDIPDWITEQTGRIPPGWRYIQIADDKGAEKLVCGYDYEGRLQVKYSAQHTQKQAAEKFRRVRSLRENREKIEQGIAGIKDDDVRDCLQLIMATGLRPGSTASARGGHYGATTLRAEHIVVEKSRVYLRFVGKEGVIHNHEVHDPELRRMLRKRRRQALKTDDQRIFHTSPDRLNKQLKAAVDSVDMSVKDLRTMKACDTAYSILKASKPVTTAKGFASLRNRVGEEVCSVLGNGRDMALGSYIDPALFIAHSPVGYEKWQQERAKQAQEKADGRKQKPKPKTSRKRKTPAGKKPEAQTS